MIKINRQEAELLKSVFMKELEICYKIYQIARDQNQKFI